MGVYGQARLKENIRITLPRTPINYIQLAKTDFALEYEREYLTSHYKLNKYPSAQGV
jgi:hypothetical protein